MNTGHINHWRQAILGAMAAGLLVFPCALAGDREQGEKRSDEPARMACMAGVRDGWIVAEARTPDGEKILWTARLARAEAEATVTVRCDGPSVVVTSGGQRIVLDARTGKVQGRQDAREGQPREAREQTERTERPGQGERREGELAREAAESRLGEPERRGVQPRVEPERGQRAEGAERRPEPRQEPEVVARRQQERLAELDARLGELAREMERTRDRLNELQRAVQQVRRQLEELRGRPLGGERPDIDLRERAERASARVRELTEQVAQAEEQLKRTRALREAGRGEARDVQLAERRLVELVERLRDAKTEAEAPSRPREQD